MHVILFRNTIKDNHLIFHFYFKLGETSER